MASIDRNDRRHRWQPHLTAPHFAPLAGQTLIPKAATRLAPMPTLGAFMLMRFIRKIGAAFRPWICVFRAHDYPESLEPVRCRRCGRSSLNDQGD